MVCDPFLSIEILNLLDFIPQKHLPPTFRPHHLAGPLRGFQTMRGNPPAIPAQHHGKPTISWMTSFLAFQEPGVSALLAEGASCTPTGPPTYVRLLPLFRLRRGLLQPLPALPRRAWLRPRPFLESSLMHSLSPSLTHIFLLRFSHCSPPQGVSALSRVGTP